ncbi:hypothetical protein E4K10_48880 [Streptomyces sp. T1317-0309]|nr:hypothetical protein E4K10_48880 [Streptomyces sp. T1317-0309]
MHVLDGYRNEQLNGVRAVLTGPGTAFERLTLLVEEWPRDSWRTAAARLPPGQQYVRAAHAMIRMSPPGRGPAIKRSKIF